MRTVIQVLSAIVLGILSLAFARHVRAETMETITAALQFTVEDLALLEKSESWSELVAHLDDVPPAKRDGTWNRIVENAAVGYLTTTVITDDPFTGLAAADGLLKEFPLLAKSKPFLAKRTEVGLSGFEACFRILSYDPTACVDRLTGFVKADPSNTELWFKAGKLVRVSANSAAAVPFFTRSGAGKCDDHDVQLAILAGLDRFAPSEPGAADSREMSRTCYGSMAAALKSELGGSAKGSNFFENTCALLREKGALSSIQTKQCGK